MYKEERHLFGKVHKVIEDPYLGRDTSEEVLIMNPKLKPLSDDRFIRQYNSGFDIWNSKTGGLEFQAISRAYVEIPETKQIVYGNKNNIGIYEGKDKVTTLKTHEAEVQDIVRVSFNTFASCDYNTVKIWNLEKRRITKTLKVDSTRVVKLLLIPGQLGLGYLGVDSLAIMSGDDRVTIRIWDMKAQNCIVLQTKLFVPEDMFTLLGGDNYLLVCNGNLGFEVWDLKTRGCIFVHKSTLQFLIPYTGNKVIFSVDYKLKILDVITKEYLNMEIKPYMKNVSLLSGNKLLVCLGKVIKIVDLEKIEIIQTLEGHEEETVAVVELANGKIASTSRRDHRMIIWSS
jgi:WD40 repeat protein